jgi:hypothetical protein
MGPQGPAGATGATGPTGPQGPIGPAGGQVWTTFLAGPLTRVKLSLLTPDGPITVTRIQLATQTSPVGCAANAVVGITDLTAPNTRTLTIDAAVKDTGPIAVDYAAGAPIYVGVFGAAAACGSAPADANVVVQYKAR